METNQDIIESTKKLLPSIIVILTIPLISAMIWVVYELHFVPMYRQLQVPGRLLVFSIPFALLIGYGYLSANKYTSTLAGLLLLPLMSTYAQIMSGVIEPYAGTMEMLEMALRPARLLNIVSGSLPSILLHGAIGYLASKRTKAHILGAIVLTILYLAIISRVH
ncbi:hypothetical protein ACT9XH_09410 [Methanococcoides methylutens]|uniref:hypothetical protein n=1 Tax=Methanococcoides methylutens TaxID=2226 RepID=UPI004043F85B